MKLSKTQRGFGIIEFKDRYGYKSSLQKSSLATEDAIWFGINEHNAQIMHPNHGWVKYDIPEDVLITTRMHLTQDHVKELLPFLQKFAETGELS